MAQVLITLKIMSEVDVNLDEIEKKIKAEIEKFGGVLIKTERIPIAFGLESINIIFSLNEIKGSTEPLEERINNIEGVSSVEVIDIRRAIG